MLPLAVAAVLFVLLHLPRLRVWPGGPSPAEKASGALGLALLIPGALHFAKPQPFVEMMPPWLPAPHALVHFAGAAEMLIAVLLLIPETRRFGGRAAVLLFIAIWPANIHVALTGHVPAPFPQSPVYAWLRVPSQLLYIVWAAWCALGHLPGRSLRRRLFAHYYDRIVAKHAAYLAERRAALLSQVSGTVVEIGPGTGVNLEHLPRGTRWIGIEPNPHMHAVLRERAVAAGLDAEIRGITADGLDLPDASADVVLSTLVLCSVGDVETVLQDIRRVLRPGGRFIFLEHVGARQGTSLRRAQAMIRPVFRCLADGCTPDREIDRMLDEAGFSDLQIERFEVPRHAAVAIVAPHIGGVATR